MEHRVCYYGLGGLQPYYTFEFKYRPIIKLERLYLMRNRSDVHRIFGAQFYEWQ